jgi:tRNA pseudouridine32 synthase/23S rRNA pseudouridine746 synthase
MREGVTPSYIWLQKGKWKTILEFLIEHFSHITQEVWQDRLKRGDVTDEAGQPLTNSTPYFWGRRIFYYRELEHETPIPVQERILFQDQHILVVDKPHFLPVIPTGGFVRETLLARLKKQLDLPELSPIHRLDRETAGVMIFSTNPTSRGRYQNLFQQRSVIKEYEALAPHLATYTEPFTYQSRIVPGTPFFRMEEIAGLPNSTTHIEIIERHGPISRYRLQPLTGRKHQLRVHLAALNVPILNDTFYPAALPCQADDLSQPLQLLARTIRFIDPFTKQERYFQSQLQLISLYRSSES